MVTRTFRGIFLILGLSALAACGGGEWKTDYPVNITAAQSKQWRVTKIEMNVPEALTVSEKNTYTPNADIVWREDPPGDRKAQVSVIMTDAMRRGTSGLKGPRPVILQIGLLEFHALSQKTRAELQQSGVHNISFTAQIFDARTAEPLTAKDTIVADLIAYSGEAAVVAVAAGQTQKVRITDHVSKVIAGWLGVGPDVRGTFKRRGR